MWCPFADLEFHFTVIIGFDLDHTVFDYSQSLTVALSEVFGVTLPFGSKKDFVKRFVKNGMFEGEPERDFFGNFEVPFKHIGKLIVPTDAEIAVNNRARSAKLRIAEKK